MRVGSFGTRSSGARWLAALCSVSVVGIAATSAQAVEFSPQAVALSQFNGLLNGPTGITVDAAGDVFVANTGANDVLELPAGASQAKVLTPFSGVEDPTGIAVDGNGDLFTIGGGEVLELQVRGQGAGQLGAAPSDGGDLRRPVSRTRGATQRR